MTKEKKILIMIVRLCLTALLLGWVYKSTNSFPLLLLLSLNAISLEIFAEYMNTIAKKVKLLMKRAPVQQPTSAW